MPKLAAALFQPRKMPVQARSATTVEAILQASVQVLLVEGKRLTTTRVAARAGVSVGTLYQYFPNKSSLLQTVLQQHLNGVAEAVESACSTMHGKPLDAMADETVRAFVDAKFRSLDASAALYAISDDVDGRRIAHAMHTRVMNAMAAMLRTACDMRVDAPASAAEVLLHAMAGVSRGALEQHPRRAAKATLQKDLSRLARGYLRASAEPAKDRTATS